MTKKDFRRQLFTHVFHSSVLHCQKTKIQCLQSTHLALAMQVIDRETINNTTCLISGTFQRLASRPQSNYKQKLRFYFLPDPQLHLVISSKYIFFRPRAYALRIDILLTSIQAGYDASSRKLIYRNNSNDDLNYTFGKQGKNTHSLANTQLIFQSTTVDLIYITRLKHF